MANRFFMCRNCAVALLEDTSQRADVLPVTRGGHGEGFANDLADDLPDIRGICPGRMSGSGHRPACASFYWLFTRLCQEDKNTDNAIIYNLTWPVFATNKPLG